MEKIRMAPTGRSRLGVKPAIRNPLFALVFVCLVGAFAAAPPAHAETPADQFKAGNAAYNDGKFADAAQQYQAAADGGLRHWALDYNLGNAYFRSGQLGKAVLHYERAFRLNSSQRDVIYNLNLATTKAGDPALPATALAALGWRAFFYFSLNAVTLIASLVFVLLSFSLALVLLGPLDLLQGTAAKWAGRLRPSSEGIAALAIALLAAGGYLGVRIYLHEKPTGVVVAPVAEVRSGPNTSYPANFTVPEGRHVLILKEQEPIEGWLEIGVPQEGLKGWVPDTAVEVI